MIVLSFICYVLAGVSLCFSCLLFLDSYNKNRESSLSNQELIRATSLFASISFFLTTIVFVLLACFVFV